MLDTSKAEDIDAWFVAFETKMRAARIPEARFLEKLEECTKVPQEVKSAAASQDPPLATYAMWRDYLLKTHGPLDPVGYFRAKFYGVRGTGREEIRKQLESFLTLHNRAAKDHGKAVCSKQDLIYPFMQAFPHDVSQRIQGQLAYAMATEDPFETLFRTAPSANVSAPAPSGPPPTVAAVEPVVNNKKRPADVSATMLLAAFKDLKKTVLQGASQNPKPLDRPNAQGRRPCRGCGGLSCTARESCPAWGKDCNKCGGRNHFASVCMKAGNTQPSFQKRPFRKAPPQDQFR